METPATEDVRLSERISSQARKKEYVQQLEKAIHILTAENMELHAKVAMLTHQLLQQSVRIAASNHE